MSWAVGDRGITKGGMRYRVICADAIGRGMPIVALLRIADDELVHRYRPDGTNDGGPQAYHLMPAKVAA